MQSPAMSWKIVNALTLKFEAVGQQVSLKQKAAVGKYSLFLSQ
jgi:hypothetical protein